MKEKILIVDDEQMIRWTLRKALVSWGYISFEAETVAEALNIFEAEQPTVVLLDINLPDGCGLNLLREIKQLQPESTVIMITANVLLDDALTALRGGAYDFIGKPINLNELKVTIRNGIEAQQLRKEVITVRKERTGRFNFAQIIGQSKAMQETLVLASKVAESEASTILLQGESGTGKDLLAKAIHYGSHRANAPFVAINCATLPANLIESELFGYEKGAFTDAKARKQGLFEQAQGGTIFLDEIGELELNLQAKLLRVLEENSFRRVGGLKDIPLDVRVIAASNRNLKTQSDAGRFRLDLYYRLSVLQIDIAALRDREDDVILLAQYYISAFNERLHRNIKGISPEVERIFRTYQWPGNVRELRNCIERALILEDGDMITTKYLPRGLMTEAINATAEQELVTLPPGGVALEDVEMALVRQAIKRCMGNQTRAAELLKISRDQLRYRLKKLEEEVQEV